MTGPTEPTPLSETRLFPGLRDFYSSSGVQAWAGTVPMHATCNPELANSYATVIIRFIQDAVATGRVEPSEPFYIVELGAGSGKLGFHLVQRLRALRHVLGLEHLRMVHVMSDVVDANIDHWRHHPRLRPFVERGEVVFARFDAESDSIFTLQSPDAIGPGSDGGTGALAEFANPLTVIANYVFDSLPQDLFRVTDDGHLEEMLATMVPGENQEPSRLAWSPRPVAFPRYRDPELDGLLTEVTSGPGPKVVMFPVTALRALRRIADAAGGRVCLLASDLGIANGLRSEPELDVASTKGFFYLPVDLSVIGRFFAGLGPGIHQHRPATRLDTSLSVSGFDAGELRETRHAFSTSAEAFGARGRGAMFTLLEHAGANLGPEEWLAVSALLGYDSLILEESLEFIPRWIHSELLPPHVRRELVACLRRFGAEIYWTPGAPDAYRSLATMLHQVGELKAAVASYVLSIETVGPSADNYVSLALALRALDRRPEALESLRDALAQDPSHVVARGWLGRIELEVAGVLPTTPAPPPAQAESGSKTEAENRYWQRGQTPWASRR